MLYSFLFEIIKKGWRRNKLGQGDDILSLSVKSVKIILLGIFHFITLVNWNRVESPGISNCSWEIDRILPTKLSVCHRNHFHDCVVIMTVI